MCSRSCLKLNIYLRTSSRDLPGQLWVSGCMGQYWQVPRTAGTSSVLDFIPEQEQNPEKGSCHPGSSWETQITATCWGLAHTPCPTPPTTLEGKRRSLNLTTKWQLPQLLQPPWHGWTREPTHISINHSYTWEEMLEAKVDSPRKGRNPFIT